MTKDVKNNKNTKTVVQEPTWQKRGFSSKEHYSGWLHFNNLVHVSDYDGVSVDDSTDQLE